MAFLTKLLLLVCATIPLGLANPVPDPVAIPDPNPIVPIQPACTTSIHIDHTAKGWPGAPQTLPGHCTPGPAGQFSNFKSPNFLSLLTHYQAVPFQYLKATHMESPGALAHLWASIFRKSSTWALLLVTFIPPLQPWAKL